MVEKYTVCEQDRGLKLLDVLVLRFKLSSRQLRKAKRSKLVRVNGNRLSFNATLSLGDEVVIVLPEEVNIFNPEPLKFGVLYEDDYVLAAEKPPFLVVHPTKGHPSGTLGNAVAHYMMTKGENYKIRFINRLDRDTSGIVLVAKNALAQQRITDQMKEGVVDKRYQAIVTGHVNVVGEVGEIDLPIGKSPDDEVKRMVVDSGKPAVTRYRLNRYVGDCSLVDIELLTGRTHQVRVHFSHIGHALLGDGLYGEPSPFIGRQALHCCRMSFLHPLTDKRIVVNSSVASDIQDATTMLEQWTFV